MVSPAGRTSISTPVSGAFRRRAPPPGSTSSIEAFGVAELIDRPVESFSGGQRRRLEIARALVSQPQVLFLDEPTVGLDPRIRHELLDVIAGLRSRHDMTILLTTHYLDEAQRLCDRVAIIHLGRDRRARHASDAARRVWAPRSSSCGSTATATLRWRRYAPVESPPLTRSRSARLSRSHSTAGRPATTISRHHDAGVKASGFTTRPPTLDDVYLRLTGAQIAEAA